MTIEFSIAHENFVKLVEEFSTLQADTNLNESQTRFSFLDTLLTECLGWPKDLIKTEVHENGDRTDYECGIPRQLILEAKKPSIYFHLPPSNKDSLRKIKLKSIISFNEVTKLSVEQVINYCYNRGVPTAALSNGSQLIIFLACRLDGISPYEADALVFDSYESQIKNFNIIFECLSPNGISDKRLLSYSNADQPGALPPKLSALCVNYYEYKYSSNFQENIRNASSLVIEDIGRTSELEPEFLKECYCESGPLSQYSLLGKNILTTRYSALFPLNETGSRIEEINPRNKREKIKDRVLAEAISRRPIVFLGDVGVGKTSFIKNLIQNSDEKEIKQSIFIYFDLGSKGVLSKEPKDALLGVIEKTLREEYKVNIQNSDLLEVIYKEELSDFDNGFMSSLRIAQPEVFLVKRLEYIQTLLSNKAEHLRKCLSELSKKRKSQVIIIIDNADQRKIEVQQEAFLIAHELASTWEALIFLSVRPQTFHSSKRSGTISAYPPKVFVIPPPKLEDVIEKRLTFALKIAEGRLPLATLRNLSMHVESLAILIRVLKYSLMNNPELYEFIINVSSGNVRVAIELISKFFGNPNVESERIVKIEKENGHYTIPVHEFAKGGLLGDNSFYQEDGSYACNVFSTIYPDKREHFISMLILGYLSWDGAHKENTDGFIGMDSIIKELQSNRFTAEQTTSHIQRLTRKKLIETTERRLLETKKDIEELGFPEAFRITPLGAYHIKRWMFDFGFIEAMSFDTPIFASEVREKLALHINEHSLAFRYERAKMFKNYLDEIWTTIIVKPYIDWNDSHGSASFSKVEKQLSDLGKLPIIN